MVKKGKKGRKKAREPQDSSVRKFKQAEGSGQFEILTVNRSGWGGAKEEVARAGPDTRIILVQETKLRQVDEQKAALRAQGWWSAWAPAVSGEGGGTVGVCGHPGASGARAERRTMRHDHQPSCIPTHSDPSCSSSPRCGPITCVINHGSGALSSVLASR